MRTLVYNKRAFKYLDKLIHKYPHLRTKILDDVNEVIPLLQNDIEIPARFKNHKLINTDIWELHLVSRGSDCLLLYRKYFADEDILEIIAITDHGVMDKIVNSSVEELL